MFCSIIIPTIGRDSLTKTVQSVLDQSASFDDYEVIVVNDSGRALSKSDWQLSTRVQVVVTQRRNRALAKNTGAAMAKGKYLLFLDDDDWLLPDALHRFWEFVQEADGNLWYYGGVQFIDLENQVLGYLNYRKTGSCFVESVAEIWIPTQASLIEADAFFQVGCFDPLFHEAEDLDLLRRVSFVGDVASMPVDVAVIRRGAKRGGATKTGSALSYIRWGRDRALEQPGAFSRLHNILRCRSTYLKCSNAELIINICFKNIVFYRPIMTHPPLTKNL